jgi:hypothetical protein
MVSSSRFSKLPRFLSDRREIYGPSVDRRFPRVRVRQSLFGSIQLKDLTCSPFTVVHLLGASSAEDVAAIVGCNAVFAQDAQDRGDRN